MTLPCTGKKQNNSQTINEGGFIPILGPTVKQKPRLLAN
jgi:hypothetical protein